MKPVLIQNLIKKNKKESTKVDPSDKDLEKAANTVFGLVFTALAVIVLGSILIGA